jgi:hypothetical protein
MDTVLWSCHLCSAAGGWWLLQIIYAVATTYLTRLEHLLGTLESTGVALFGCCLFVACSVGGSPHQLVLKLPVFINKFIEETVMGSADFFSRWKQLAKYKLAPP